MWSPTLVPKPKDWPDYVDVVGTFFDSGEIRPKTDTKTPQSSSSVNNAKGSAASLKSAGSTSASSFHNSKWSTSLGNSKPHVTSEATPEPQEYQPSAALLTFLDSEVPIVFIGFGSMVITHIEALIRLFLEAAALAGVRVLIQVGWSTITPERFLELALEAQEKTAVVRKTEFMNRSVLDSAIFPSAKEKGKKGKGTAETDVLIDAIKKPTASQSQSQSQKRSATSKSQGSLSASEDEGLDSDAEYQTNMGLDSPPRKPTGQSPPEKGQPAPPHTPSAPSNMLTGWFYTALSTFVAPKKEVNHSCRCEIFPY